jgi:predicted transposase/invertase (TIGR01784 family)
VAAAFSIMAQRYLDPKNDIVFKRIFGEHPLILRSFLNALLPLPEDGQIVTLDYLSPEQVPQLPLLKHSIVDVRCQDQQGRQFIVEMQMNWTSAFLQRVLFNASKAYVRQLERGEQYELLQPVVGLSLLDDIFDRKSDDYYHHYQLVNVGQPERVIKDLQLVFIELPKFKTTPAIAPLKRAWLRFLRETGGASSPEAQEILRLEVASQAPEIKNALELSGEAGFSRGELEAYDRYWDAVSSERTLIAGKFAEGRAEGELIGEARGEARGEERTKVALMAKLIASGMSEEAAKRLVY